MSDISRKQMGLIIGLVIGLLGLALLAVVAYIMYDRRKEKLYGIFRFSGPQDAHRMPPPAPGGGGGGGGGQNWTTINNSMIGLEIHSNMYGGNCGQEADQHHAAQEGGNGVLSDADRKSCLTVLFDWDPRKPLPPPFRTFDGLGAHQNHNEDDAGSAGSLPIRAEYPPSPVRGEVQLTLAPEDEVPPRPDGGAVAAGAPARDPIVSLRLWPEPDVPAVAGVVGASDGSVVKRTGSPMVSVRLDPGPDPGANQSLGRGSVQGRPRSAASSEGGGPQQPQASGVNTPLETAAEPPGLPTGGATPPAGPIHAVQPPAAEGRTSLGTRPAPSPAPPEESVLGGGAVALAADATVNVSRSQGSSGAARPPALLGDAEAHISSAEGSKVLSSAGVGSPTARSVASGGCVGSPTEKDKNSGRLDLRSLVVSGTVGAS